MNNALTKKRVILLVEQLFQDLEVWYPKIRLSEDSIDVVTAAPELKTYQGKYGVPIQPDYKISDIQETDFDGIIIPGGFAPDYLRRDPDVLRLLQAFNRAGKLVAFICHGGWVPISANIVRGRQGTSFIAIKDDMVNAGCEWKDEPVVIDHNFVSSRTPNDLTHFCRGIIQVLHQVS